MDFPPKAFQNWIGHSGRIFWATPSKFCEKSYLLKINKWRNYGFDSSTGFRFSKISVECSIHIYRRPWVKQPKLKRLKWIKVLYSNATTKIKINGFPAKNLPKLNWLWRAYFLSHTLHILWEVISFKDKQMVKLWFWYLHWFQI